MTSRGDPAKGKIEITEEVTYREDANGSLNEPLRLVSSAYNRKQCSHLDIRKAYIVSLSLLEPLRWYPPVLDKRSRKVLQERVAILIESIP